MISIFEVKPEMSLSGVLLPHESDFSSAQVRTLLRPRGILKREVWGKVRRSTILQPASPLGDIAAFSTFGIAVRQEVFSKTGLAKFFGAANTELLPLENEDRSEWYLLNLIDPVDCVALDRSNFFTDGRTLTIEFVAGRLPDRNVFAVSSAPALAGAIFCIQGRNTNESEFKANAEAHSLKGLRFELVWDNINGGKQRGPKRLLPP